MIRAVKILLSFVLTIYFLPVFAKIEKYDKILENLNKYKTSDLEIPKLNKWVLTFEHKKLPGLNGVWVMRKKSIKRINTSLVKEVSQVQCNSRLPFEERPFEKEIVISSQGQDYFVFKAVYPASKDVHFNLNKTNKVEYQNFGLKGVVIPREITYVYTLKLVNHLENPALARQLWLSGKLNFEKLSRDKISGKGYELEYTPECLGFVRDEIEFELIRREIISL